MSGQIDEAIASERPDQPAPAAQQRRVLRQVAVRCCRSCSCCTSLTSWIG